MSHVTQRNQGNIFVVLFRMPWFDWKRIRISPDSSRRSLTPRRVQNGQITVEPPLLVLSLSLSLSFSWKLRIPCGLSMHTRTTNDARIFIVVQKYTRREIYRKVLLIARWPHKSTLWPLPVIAGTTCVPRDFNDEAKRCDASLRVSDNVYILR